MAGLGGENSEVRTARKGWRVKEGKDIEVMTARKGWQG